MGGEWPLRRLGDLSRNHDARRVPVRQAERIAGPYPYYGASGVVDHVHNFIFDGEFLLVAEDGENLRTRQTPVAFMASGKFWVNNHAHIITGNEHALTRYLHYALQVVDISPYLTGAVMPKLTQHSLNRIEVPTPAVAEQRAIAELLGALDDKIQLNLRMAETLEATARALFKSWFVDFDPVRAKAEGRPTGLPDALAALFPARLADDGLPEGWRVAPLYTSFDITMGQSPPGSTYNEVGAGLPFYQGRSDFTFRFPKLRVYCTAPTRFASRGDTLVSVRAPVGDLNMANGDCAIGRGVAAVRHKSKSRSFTFYALKSYQTQISAFDDSGTVFGSINKEQLEGLPTIAICAPLVTAFDAIASAADDRIDIALKQADTLADLRDALLPKLISGELRIRDAELTVAAA